MSGLGHFTISSIRDREKFKPLALWFKNMDRDDFLPFGYFMDENLHPSKRSQSASQSTKGESSSRMAKRKVIVVAKEVLRNENEDDTAIGLAAKEGGKDRM